MNSSEVELLKMSQNGDREAFGKLYEKYFQKVYRYALFNVGRREEAQDIAQDSFVKAWEKIKKFEIKSNGSFQAFVFQICRNLIIDRSRKKKIFRIDEEVNITSNEDLVQEVAKSQDKNRLMRSFERLEEKERQIITLRFFEEMSFSEISVVLDINEGALRVRVHRILKKLKDIFEYEQGN